MNDTTDPTAAAEPSDAKQRDAEQRVTEQRVTEEWFVQTRQPDGWERTSSAQPTIGRGRERLAALQRRFPTFNHRLRHRTHTVVDETVLPGDTDTPFDPAPDDA